MILFVCLKLLLGYFFGWVFIYLFIYTHKFFGGRRGKSSFLKLGDTGIFFYF